MRPAALFVIYVFLYIYHKYYVQSSESWKFIKNIRLSNSGKSQINLISADVWEKYYYKLLVEDRKEFLDKDERLLKKVKVILLKLIAIQ